MTNHELADVLETQGQALAEWALARMYEDPFWDARFGERGRRFSREDGLTHVRYLVESLRGSVDTMVSYARWLQTLVTSRGMCTRHVAENFARLAEAIGREIDDSEAAQKMLAAARAALAYPAEGSTAHARNVQDASEAIAKAWHEALGGGPSPSRDELLTLVSYLADTLAVGKSAGLAEHMKWAVPFFERRGVPAGRWREAFASLRKLLPAQVAPDAAAAASAVLVATEESLAPQA
jgi:hypothetical protein